eukprot:225101-Chlamydomonas_euryale.AAC.13
MRMHAILRARRDPKACHERDAASAHAESCEAQLSSKCRECDAFQAALLSEQRRVDELQQVRLLVMWCPTWSWRWTLKNREAEVASLVQAKTESGAKLQKALESLTASQVSQRRQAAETEGKISTLTTTMARMRKDRDAIGEEAAAAVARGKEAIATVEKLKAELKATTAEKEELLSMCNQLLSQVEHARQAQPKA